MRWNTRKMVEMRRRGGNGEMEHQEKGGNEEERSNTRKLVKNVFRLHFEIKTKQITDKNKTDKIVQKVNNR